MASISKHYTRLKTWEDIYNEAVFLRIKGDFKGALNLHLSILDLEPENDFPAQFHNLGFLLLQDNQREKAVPFLHKGLELYDRIIDKLTKFQNLNSSNNKEISDDFEFPDLPEWHEDESIAFYIYGKSSINALLGNKEECLKLLEEAIQLDEYFSLEAEKDDDFVELLSDPDFIQLLNISRFVTLTLIFLFVKTDK
jgi:tetratricopeptide (TPR) repeat protein